MIMKIDKAKAIAEAELEYARDEGIAKGKKIGREEERKKESGRKTNAILNLMQTSLIERDIRDKRHRN